MGTSCSGSDSPFANSADPGCCPSRSGSIVKSQTAYVEHVLECIRRVNEDSAHGAEAVFASRTLQDAILRNLQVLCESIQRIDERYKQEHPDIQWGSIAGIRNLLAHDYFELDFETIWRIVERDIPALDAVLRTILAELNEQPVIRLGRLPPTSEADLRAESWRRFSRRDTSR